MPPSIRPVRVNHMNMVLEDVGASVAHFRDVYGADQLADMPQKELHAYLIEIGRVIFEGFVPHEFLTSARYGPHYVGVEYQADMDEVREAAAGHGIRIVRDIGLALHTHPDDCFGVAFEFYGGYFHDRAWDMLGGEKMKPASYWRDKHPLGLTGLVGYSMAVGDQDAASRFLESFLSARFEYEQDRPDIAARASGWRIADAVVELLSPVGEGVLSRHLDRYGDGIRSTIFGVSDIGQAKDYLAGKGLDLVAGDAPGAIAVPESDNLGVIFEFRE